MKLNSYMFIALSLLISVGSANADFVQFDCLSSVTGKSGRVLDDGTVSGVAQLRCNQGGCQNGERAYIGFTYSNGLIGQLWVERMPDNDYGSLYQAEIDLHEWNSTEYAAIGVYRSAAKFPFNKPNLIVGSGRGADPSENYAQVNYYADCTFTVIKRKKVVVDEIFESQNSSTPAQ